MSTTAQTITTRDFDKSTTSVFYDRWSREAMECVVDALDGRKVIAVTTDTMTGHTVCDVRLTAIRQNPYGGGYQVLIEYEYEPGQFNRTWTAFEKIGQIVVNEERGKYGKWDAVRLWSERGYAGKAMSASLERNRVRDAAARARRERTGN